MQNAQGAQQMQQQSQQQWQSKGSQQIRQQEQNQQYQPGQPSSRSGFVSSDTPVQLSVNNLQVKSFVDGNRPFKEDALENVMNEQVRLHEEKENVKKKEEEIKSRLEAMKHIEFTKEDIELLKEREQKEKILALIDSFAQSKKEVFGCLKEQDIEGAKVAYKKLRYLYAAFPESPEKKNIQEDITSVYDQIDMVERTLEHGKQANLAEHVLMEATTLPEENQEARALARIKELLIKSKERAQEGRINEAMLALADARSALGHITHQDIRARAQHAIATYEARITTLGRDSSAVTPQKRYAEGLAMLYAKNKKDAITIFTALASEEPNNAAVKLRLQEAQQL
jgi:hypothetical protein